MPSPDWHEEVLYSRRAKIERGEAEFLSLAQVKKQVSLGRLDHQMKMVVQQAIRMHRLFRLLTGLTQSREKPLLVVVILENTLSATNHDSSRLSRLLQPLAALMYVIVLIVILAPWKPVWRQRTRPGRGFRTY